jgi:hypothetical protein
MMLYVASQLFDIDTAFEFLVVHFSVQNAMLSPLLQSRILIVASICCTSLCHTVLLMSVAFALGDVMLALNTHQQQQCLHRYSCLNYTRSVVLIECHFEQHLYASSVC